MTHRLDQAVDTSSVAMTPEPYMPYPVPVTPGPTPWWNFMARRRKDRLHLLLESHRMTVDAHTRMLNALTRAHDAENNIERVRNWNTALLKDKADLRATVADLEAKLQETHGRVVDAMIRRDQAETAVRQLTDERDSMEVDLKKSLDRCAALADKLSARKKR